MVAFGSSCFEEAVVSGGGDGEASGIGDGRFGSDLLDFCLWAPWVLLMGLGLVGPRLGFLCFQFFSSSFE